MHNNIISIAFSIRAIVKTCSLAAVVFFMNEYLETSVAGIVAFEHLHSAVAETCGTRTFKIAFVSPD